MDNVPANDKEYIEILEGLVETLMEFSKPYMENGFENTIKAMTLDYLIENPTTLKALAEKPS